MVRYSKAQSLDRPYSPKHNPLPYKNGVNATRLRIPDTLQDGSSGTIGEYLLERFPHIDPESFQQRFDVGEIVGIAGAPIFWNTALSEHTFIWYYRELPDEEKLPVDISIIYSDDDLIVIDKPHFLPTTPGGKFVQETALIRLRRFLGQDNIVPIHRLDRLTAGVLLFSRNPKTRGKYQVLFEKRQVEKKYEAIAPVNEEMVFPQVVSSRIIKIRGVLRAEEIEGAPNSKSVISLSKTLENQDKPGTNSEKRGLYDLIPFTGKTHQLRLHMNQLGIPIHGDPFYPQLQENAPDDYDNPLKLLAKSISFRDPLSGKERFFESSLHL